VIPATMDADMTSKAALDLLPWGRPAETRAATDIVSPIGLLGQLAAARSSSDHSSPGSVNALAIQHFDAWLFETLSAIDSYRSVREGWDGGKAAVPTGSALNTAELLVAFFVLMEPEKRPSLCFDVLGRPTFAVNGRDFYLHLTVDGLGKLTWYAVEDGNEYFEDDVTFVGRHLPDDLARIISLNVA
jgi:hypothetical protein